MRPDVAGDGDVWENATTPQAADPHTERQREGRRYASIVCIDDLRGVCRVVGPCRLGVRA